MIRRLLVCALLVATLSTVLASAAHLSIGEVVLYAAEHNVSVGPIGHCADLPAETVCIEVPPPSAPTGLGCDIDLHEFAATLSWDSVPAAEKYDIYHGVLWIGPEHLDTVAAGQTSYGLRPALLHHRYNVTATHLGGESARSATLSVHCAPWWLFYSGPHALGASTLLDPEFEAALAGPVETETAEGEGGDEAMRLDGGTLALARSLAPASPEDGAAEDASEAEPEPTSEPAPEPEAVELPPTRIVELSWAQDGRSQLYVVLRSTTPGGPYAQAGVVEGGSFSDEVATAATYFYVVVGVDEQGAESHPSEEIVSPGIVLPPVLKAPKPLAPMAECPEDSEEPAVAIEGEDGELLCAIPAVTATPTPIPTATPTPAPSPKPGDGECADISLEEPCEPSAGPPPEAGGGKPGGGAGGGSEPGPTPVPTATPTPPAEPTATPTAESTPAATPSPEPTPLAEPTPDAAVGPEATPEQSPDASSAISEETGEGEAPPAG